MSYNKARKVAEERIRCERSFYEFYKEAFKVLEPGTEYIDNWHVEYLCWLVQREFFRIQAKIKSKWKDIIINVPPRTSKSLIFSVMFPVWAWIQDPTFRMITGSYSLSLAESFSFQSIALINSDWFQERWGDRFSISKSEGGKESVGHTVNTKMGARKVVSTLSAFTGFGGMMVFIDDPVNPVQADSDAKTEEVNKFYDKTLPSRLNNRNLGVFFTIMQRLSENDPTQHLINKGDRYLHVRLPAERDGTELMPGIEKLPHLKPYPDGLLFPGILGREVLEGMKKTSSGRMEFATQYQQKPAPEGGIYLKKEHLLKISPEDFERRFWSVRKNWQFYGDTSMGRNTRRTDPTAMGACCQIGRDLYVRIIEDKRVPAEDLPDYVVGWVNLHGYSKMRSVVMIEPKSSGPMVTGILKKSGKINVRDYEFPEKGAVNINSAKVEKFQSIVPAVPGGLDDGGRVYFIDGPWFDKFAHQVTVFPNGSNDDMADVLVMMVTDFTYGRIGRYAEFDEPIKIFN